MRNQCHEFDIYLIYVVGWGNTAQHNAGPRSSKRRMVHHRVARRSSAYADIWLMCVVVVRLKKMCDMGKMCVSKWCGVPVQVLMVEQMVWCACASLNVCKQMVWCACASL